MSESLPVMKTTEAYKEGRQAAREELARGAEYKIVEEHLAAPALEGEEYFEQFDMGYVFELREWMKQYQLKN